MRRDNARRSSQWPTLAGDGSRTAVIQSLRPTALAAGHAAGGIRESKRTGDGSKSNAGKTKSRGTQVEGMRGASNGGCEGPGWAGSNCGAASNEGNGSGAMSEGDSATKADASGKAGETTIGDGQPWRTARAAAS